MDVSVKRMVYLATLKNLQTSVLEERLKQNFSLQIIHPVDLLSDAQIFADQAILIDLAAVSGKDVEHLLPHITAHCPRAKVALFNADRSQNIQMLSSYRIRGIFYSDDSFALLEKGIRSLLSGEYWFSRKTMESLLEFIRAREEATSVVRKESLKEELTRREKQILKLVSTGATNTEIAGKIFLSENTVKTHLSNLYRKLEIRNRTQATAWAKNNRWAMGDQ